MALHYSALYGLFSTEEKKIVDFTKNVINHRKTIYASKNCCLIEKDTKKVPPKKADFIY